MSKVVITQEELNQIIEKNWNQNLEFLKDISEQKRIPLQEILSQNKISKPDIKDIAEYIGLVAEEKYEFDREVAAMTALCACISEDILSLIAQRLKSK